MSQIKNTVITPGKTKKTMLLALFLLVALIVFMSLPKPDKSEALAQSRGGAPGGGAGGGGAPAMPAMPVTVDAVGLLDHTQPVPKVGTVAAKETVQLVPRVSGYLMNVAFTEGEFVQEGDLLFEIEDTIYQINVRMAESVIKQIEAEIALAKRNHERIAQLVPSRSATEQELDEALRTINLHEARLEEAKARLDQAQTDLGYTKIYAPLSGRIGAKQFSKGNYLTPASGVLATIMQFDPISVTFPVTEREFSTYFLPSGEKKEAKIEILYANGTPCEEEFHIDFYDNYVESTSGQILVYLLCENKSGKLFPGGFTRVNLSEKFEEAKPAVKVSALQTDGTSHFVYVVQKDGEAPKMDAKGQSVVDDAGKPVMGDTFRVERRTVTPGQQVSDKQIITSGLTPGEMVVIGGLNKIMMPGQPIIPVPVAGMVPSAQPEQPAREAVVTEEQSEEIVEP
ncbi:MAG: efflux RND transporter periplasmic adaptor subunit [Planctomycetaceae bacterium]|nr:efflux RND transporter periplasmic adaptor subunit [Planctomycetaceae bacterium]